MSLIVRGRGTCHLAFVPGSPCQLVSAGLDNRVLHWSIAAGGGKLHRTLHQYQQPIHSLVISKTGEYVASSGQDATTGNGMVLVHSLATGQEVLHLPLGRR
jgi:WD40 repeat protein